MSENKNDIKVNELQVVIQDLVKDFAERLLTALGDNLQSITVVGSSLTEDFRPGTSDINTVLVLDKQTTESLNAIASLAKPVSRKKLSPPLLMTKSYIERSQDVFGVEFLDFQLAHKTIMGNDPFASLSFDKKDVRLQCERELKAMLIRLRQGYIAAAANKKLVRDILISTAKGMAPLLRAMLWLKDIERSARAESTFNKAAGEFSIDTNSLASAMKWRFEKIRLNENEMETSFESVYSAIDQLADIVDKLKV
jgi:methyl-accepting chemotaxis protein